MSKKWSNENLPGALHFITGNSHNRKKIFSSSEPCRAFLSELQKLRTTHPCKLVAFVLMPEHFHIVANPEDGDIRSFTGKLKSLSAKRLVEIMQEGSFLNIDRNQVWQESFKALPLWSSWMIWQKINYIHANPVKAGIVSSTKDHPWSSFHSFYLKDDDPLLQVDEEWWWPDDVDKLRKAAGNPEERG